VPIAVFLTVKTSEYPTRSDIGREMTKGWYNGVRVTPGAPALGTLI